MLEVTMFINFLDNNKVFLNNLYNIVQLLLILVGIASLIIRLEPINLVKKILRIEYIFTFRRIESEVSKLSRNIKQDYFKPDKIIGIGGGRCVGGTIIGSLLASRKYMDTEFIPIELIRPIDRYPPKSEQSVCSKSYYPTEESLAYLKQRIGVNEKILIVDDISKRGESLKNVIDYLKNNLEISDIKVAVIVRFDDKVVKNKYGCKPFFDKHFWENNFCNNKSHTSNIKFPWHMVPKS